MFSVGGIVSRRVFFFFCFGYLWIYSGFLGVGVVFGFSFEEDMTREIRSGGGGGKFRDFLYYFARG